MSYHILERSRKYKYKHKINPIYDIIYLKFFNLKYLTNDDVLNKRYT